MLDTGAESIRIEEKRREVIAGDSEETKERLYLHLTEQDQMQIKAANGQYLSIEKASEYILRRFLK